ncbi:hypothetical protein SPV1_13197 [Mariprofundus ferrooxydans PV-1]|uniref:Uncharacterized protein n=1 Tax=Mariprofundus ferrooxydans PV-1 TaxID=314345 RepID=Q0EXG0_9PROT|nr:hypothetical protein SPV1_13197 [Mariprofundus ferrooxydans PV-1]
MQEWAACGLPAQAGGNASPSVVHSCLWTILSVMQQRGFISCVALFLSNRISVGRSDANMKTVETA